MTLDRAREQVHNGGQCVTCLRRRKLELEGEEVSLDDKQSRVVILHKQQDTDRVTSRVGLTSTKVTKSDVLSSCSRMMRLWAHW